MFTILATDKQTKYLPDIQFVENVQGTPYT